MKTSDRTEFVGVRMTARDRKAFEQAASDLHMDLSEFIRAATLMYLAITLNPHGLKAVGKGVSATIRDQMARLREPGLRRIVSE